MCFTATYIVVYSVSFNWDSMGKIRNHGRFRDTLWNHFVVFVKTILPRLVFLSSVCCPYKWVILSIFLMLFNLVSCMDYFIVFEEKIGTEIIKCFFLQCTKTKIIFEVFTHDQSFNGNFMSIHIIGNWIWLKLIKCFFIQ